MKEFKVLLFAVAIGVARSHVAYWRTPNHLHHVQGLYINPSTDGSTGDLYVSATEENGVKTQWLTDQPINYLPTAAAQHAALPYSYLSSFSASSLPHDENVVTAQKRAVITSPAFKYTYALPTTPGAPEGSTAQLPTYPYAIPAVQSTPTSTEGSTECTDNLANQLAYSQYPYYYYPQMMAAFANALSNALKETGANEEAVNTASQAAQTPQTTPMWPYPYPYPVQYVMVDPATWAQNQAATTTAAPTTTTSPTAESNENS